MVSGSVAVTSDSSGEAFDVAYPGAAVFATAPEVFAVAVLNAGWGSLAAGSVAFVEVTPDTDTMDMAFFDRAGGTSLDTTAVTVHLLAFERS